MEEMAREEQVIVEESIEKEATVEESIEKEATVEETIEQNVEKVKGDIMDRDGRKAGSTEKGAGFGETVRSAVRTLWEQRFQVERKDEELISMPLLVFILVMLIGFEIVLPLMIVGLFFGCHYRFAGAKEMVFDVNKMSDRASQFAEDIKADFRKA